MRRADVAALRSRWRGSDRDTAVVEFAKSGDDWTKLLARSEGSETSALPFLESCRRTVIKGEAAPRDLRGITFINVDLSNETAFADTSFDFGRFENVQFYQASITGTSFESAIFGRSCSFAEAVALRASFVNADCKETSFRNANLSGADLRGCDLRDADLSNTNLGHVRITREGPFGFLSIRKHWTRFGGDYQTFGNMHSDTPRWLRRHIAEESEIALMRRVHPAMTYLWYMLSNNGRSAARLGLWAAIVWLGFALLFSTPPVPSWLAHTQVEAALTSVAPRFVVSGVEHDLSFGQALYLSTVTITTLGLGDITPSLGSAAACAFVSAEALFGFLLLGAFVALLVQSGTIRSD